MNSDVILLGLGVCWGIAFGWALCSTIANRRLDLLHEECERQGFGDAVCWAIRKAKGKVP